MQPSNQQERKKAFWNFLMFFCITVGVIVVTMLFSFQVPFKERDMLRGKVDVADNHRLTLRDFAQKMRLTINLIDTIDRVKNTFAVESRIKTNVQSMSDIADKDTTWAKDMMRDAVYSLTSLTESKLNLLKSSDNKEELEKKDQRIEKLEEKLQECKDKLSAASRAAQ